AISIFQQALALNPLEARRRSELTQELQKCERMRALEKKLTAIQQGSQTPANADEAILLAQMCRYQKRFAAAVPLYAKAFHYDARLAANLEQEYRYDAARCAVLAASLPDKDAVALRRQALEWLRAD